MNRITIAALVLGGLCRPVLSGTNYTYLALGDSIPFGMNITLVPPYSSVIPTPSDFIGYPEIVAAGAHVTELNASCPGETSGSFLNTTVPDNGCNSVHVEFPAPGTGLQPIILPPIKTTIGLHTPYTNAQMDFAVAQLTANKNIDLVTLNIGANDVLLVLPALEACGSDTTCANNVLTPVLGTYANNLAAILTGIRAVYQGTLILMTYYSPAPALDGLTEAVNATMTEVAAGLSTKPGFAPVTIADGFTAFQQASAKFGGDACKAGLLIPLPPSPYDLSACDIHPSAAGRTLLADLIEFPSTGTSCNGAFVGTFVGNLKVAAGQTCMFVGGGVTGNITQTGGNLILSGTTVGGNLQIQGAGGFSLGGGARITGNLQILNLAASSAQNQICGVGVGGNLTYQSSAAPVEMGAASMCPGNTVGGNLQVTSNTAAVGIAGNSVTGNMQVVSDTGSTTVFNNKVAKNLQCTGNTTITGGGNTALQKSGQCAAF